MNSTSFLSILNRAKGSKELLENEVESLSGKIESLKQQLFEHEKAREVIKEVGIKTQEQLQYRISDITTLAMESVFPEPYQLSVEFVQRRNKTECDLLFVRDDMKIEPLSASGGGTVDVAAFALRIASWSLQRPTSRGVIILDEPMRFVSENLKDKASQMIKEVSEKLGIQFIIITHEPKLAAFADRTFEVKKKKGISIVSLPS